MLVTAMNSLSVTLARGATLSQVLDDHSAFIDGSADVRLNVAISNRNAKKE